MQLLHPSLGPIDASQAAQALSDSNPDFMVVGLCSAESNASGTDATAALGMLLSGQQTSPLGTALQGIQMHVHPRDRVIVLDASRILSSDVIAGLLAADRLQPAVGAAAATAVRAAAARAGSSSTIPVEGVASLLSLQILTLLLAVCNVVVVGASEMDVHLLQLLESCCLLTSSIPDIALPTAAVQQHQQQAQAATRRGMGQQKQQHAQHVRPGSSRTLRHQTAATATAVQHHLADLLLLHSCSSMQDLLPHNLASVQEFVAACLSDTQWARRPQRISSAAHGSYSHRPHHSEYVDDGSSTGSSSCKGLNVWAVPVGDIKSSGYVGTAEAGDAALKPEPMQQQMPYELQQLANKLLALPRTLTAASSSGSGSSSGCFSRPLSEKEWLRGVQRVWEAVQDSSELLQYYSTAATARYVGAGGWRQR